MASFQWAVPTGKGARRVARSMTSFGGGRGASQETFDAFEASDAGAEAFTMRQDEEELEVTIPVDEATAKKDVSVNWSFGKTKGAKALILTLEKRDGDTWAKLLAKTPPAPADAAAFLRLPWDDRAYWKQNEDDDSAWRAYSEATDGPLCACGVGVLAMRAVYTTWRRVVDAVASPGLFDEAELALARRWCYAPKRHSMDTGRGLEKTLVAAAGGPFQHGDWETPYPLPDRCDDSCVIVEARNRPVCRAAMMDYVLNWIVQTMCTVAGAAPTRQGPPKEFMDAWFDKGNELKGAGDDDMLYVEVPGWVMDLALTHHVSSGVPRPRRFSRDVDREASSPMHPAERVVLELLPAEDGEPTGLDTPAARGNLSGFDMRLEDWSSVPGALELAARNPQAEQMRNMFAGK
ncbi:hypothetical protein JL722_10595 [Aureococcus anophagefferens]|nr:hypothetical protein JL722_10595 [Aureococcus anophagefferens]